MNPDIDDSESESEEEEEDENEEDETDMPKRRKVTEVVNIDERLEQLIQRIGEEGTTQLSSNLQGLSSVLNDDYANHKDTILRVLYECVLEQRHKITIYSTLVGLLNARNLNAGSEFVDMMVRNLKEALKACKWDDARIMIRFLCDLINCRVLTPSSVLKMLENFVDVILDRNIPQVRSDWYVYAVLSALPWVGGELQEKKKTDFAHLIKAIDGYIQRRQKVHVPALRVWSSDDPHPQEEYIDCLWAQIRHLESNGWVEKHILRPYLAFDLSESSQNALPHIIPPSHNDDTTYPLPTVVFRMFDYTDVPEETILPGAHTIERFLIEEELQQIFDLYHLERKICVEHLLKYKPHTTGGKLIPTEYMIIEVIFGMLFRLPTPPHIELAYCAIVIELCRQSVETFPLVTSQLTQMLYNRIDTMHSTCIDRFTNWLSYHLSHLQYGWDWEDWRDAISDDLDMPKARFVKELLQRCMRLSYHKRVVDIMPEEFGPLLPMKPFPQYRYTREELAEDDDGRVAAMKLHAAFKQKCKSDACLTILKTVPNPLDEEDGSSAPALYNPLKIDVFVQTLFYLGSKSFSHSFAAISKFHVVLKLLGDTEQAQVSLLRSLYDLWFTHQQMLIVLVDKLLKTEVVECCSVIDWLFSDQIQPELTSFFVWEIMHSTIGRMNAHVTRIRREVEETRDRYEAEQRRLRGLDGTAAAPPTLVTEMYVEQQEERLRSAYSQQRRLFTTILKHFIRILTDHIDSCESNMISHSTNWFKWISERMQQLLLQHHEQVYRYQSHLESQVFAATVDVNILQVFQQFCALKA